MPAKELTKNHETVSIEIAAARLGISLSKAYELAKQDGALHPQVPVLRFGRKLAVPVRALDKLLLLTEEK